MGQSDEYPVVPESQDVQAVPVKDRHDDDVDQEWLQGLLGTIKSRLDELPWLQGHLDLERALRLLEALTADWGVIDCIDDALNFASDYRMDVKDHPATPRRSSTR